MNLSKNTELIVLMLVGFFLLNAPIVPYLKGKWLFGLIPAPLMYSIAIWIALAIWLYVSYKRDAKPPE